MLDVAVPGRLLDTAAVGVCDRVDATGELGLAEVDGFTDGGELLAVPARNTSVLLAPTRKQVCVGSAAHSDSPGRSSVITTKYRCAGVGVDAPALGVDESNFSAMQIAFGGQSACLASGALLAAFASAVAAENTSLILFPQSSGATSTTRSHSLEISANC